MGGLLGLDYAAVELVLRARSIQIQTLTDIQEIERGAIAVFNEQRDD